jgi:hypothetical protein
MGKYSVVEGFGWVGMKKADDAIEWGGAAAPPYHDLAGQSCRFAPYSLGMRLSHSIDAMPSLIPSDSAEGFFLNPLSIFPATPMGCLKRPNRRRVARELGQSNH